MAWRRTLVLVALSALAQQQELKFDITTKLVIVNVEVKDSQGRPIDNLRREDFQVFEDGKAQAITVFEYQRLENPEPAAIQRDRPTIAATGAKAIAPSAQGEVKYRDRRLLVLFFDQSSMATEEQLRAQKAAQSFIREKMTPADLVAVMTFSSSLRVIQDFTGDRDELDQAIKSLRIGETSDLAADAATGETETGQDMGAAFTADETEFNIFNTDRKLSALEDATKALASLPEKKALVYFSSGVSRTGMENQAQLRATVNAALRANVAFYPVDARGLVAEAPLGDATQAGTRGSSMYSGQGQQARRSSFQTQQETLYTLAADTGGKVFLDNNDLSLGIVQAQQGISSYYILGYASTNPVEDGRYRRITVKLNSQLKAKLDYRSGYFAAKSFDKFTTADRERQLEEALQLGNPITDLSLAVEVNYFRRDRDRYIVPVAVMMPGSSLLKSQKKDAEKVRLDFIGQVRNDKGPMAGAVRDNIEVKVSGETTEQLNRRRVQYDTAFTLPPGDYILKFLVRENATGKMGTFETKFTVPDLDKRTDYLRLSSVVWSNQREPLSAAIGRAESDKKLSKNHPLVMENGKLIPSITKVFRRNQNLMVFFEAYAPGLDPATKQPSLAATISVFQGQQLAFESPAVRLSSAPNKAGAVPIEVDVALDRLKQGEYTCQLNVIDSVGRKFAFDRTRLVLLP